jgi:hypothetical protein
MTTFNEGYVQTKHMLQCKAMQTSQTAGCERVFSSSGMAQGNLQ